MHVTSAFTLANHYRAAPAWGHRWPIHEEPAHIGRDWYANNL
ncbi:MAG: hypothetical protein ACYDIC_13735 [Desulfobaccales bacterium]